MPPSYYPRKLGKLHCHIIDGHSLYGQRNGVVLIVVGIQPGGAAAPQFCYFAGAACHLRDTRNDFFGDDLVLTRDFTMTSEYGVFEFIKGKVQIWALPACQWVKIHDQNVKTDLYQLQRIGAVQAKGYYSLGGATGLPEIDRRYDNPANCVIVVKLFHPLWNLPPCETYNLNKRTTANLVNYLMNLGASAEVEMVVEGLAYYTSADINTRPDNALQVGWIETDSRTRPWTSKKGAGILAQDLAQAISSASKPVAGTTDELSLEIRERVGKLFINELFTPHGFGGGGAYIKVPVKALYPSAPGDTRDMCILLGTCLGHATDGKCMTILKLLTQEWVEDNLRSTITLL